MLPPLLSTALLPLLLAQIPSVASFDCGKIVVDGVKYDLSKLGGPRSVVTSKYDSSAEVFTNTTFTVDICKPLKKSGSKKATEQCPNGTRVCGIERHIKHDSDNIEHIYAIAGSLEDHGGSVFDTEIARLNGSDSHSDAKKNGLRLVLKGGKFPLDGAVNDRKPQKAIIELICDEDKEGTEGEWESEDKYEKTRRADKESDDDKKDDGKKEDDGKKGDEDEGDGSKGSFAERQLKNKDTALLWESFNRGGDPAVLRLTWHTKYACEKRSGGGDPDGDNDGDGSSSKQWGFFTWFVIVVFLGIAAYLIFGSWLNYNRYGARGWDLVPHGDMIRDAPYLMKDWTRRVLNTVQGTGSRGGYSAV